MKLWELAEELEAIGCELAENGGELTPELEARLDAQDGAFDAKVEAIALLIQERKGLADMAKAEQERLAAIRKSHDSAARGLTSYLLYHLRRSGKTKVETHRARVRVQKNGQPSISWTKNLDELPEAYRRVSIAPDLALVREQLKTGGEPPEGFRIDYGFHLRIF